MQDEILSLFRSIAKDFNEMNIATVINTGRPKRDKRKPPQYDASTGKWI